MARSATVAARVQSLLGTPVVATTPVAGGQVCTATRVRLSDGRSVLAKTRAHPPPGFFTTEARGLRWLAEAGGAPVPEVLACGEDCLVLTWVEAGRPGPEAATAFGAALARTHAAGAPSFGGPADGYIGPLPLPNHPAPTWAQFYATRRVEPYLRAARDRGTLSQEDAGAVDAVLDRIAELAGPEEPPARLHGDLWSGNLLWDTEDRVWLVDPAAHGGHRETDLAMLALFGAPHLPQILEAYQATTPLAPAWPERVGLHQLHPLLVHAVLFGGGYGARAAQAARSVLDARPAAS